ncbi:hypothetical protein ES703_45392 [subsurface metagenome]
MFLNGLITAIKITGKIIASATLIIPLIKGLISIWEKK